MLNSADAIRSFIPFTSGTKTQTTYDKKTGEITGETTKNYRRR